jgi:hypothetical protein
MNDDEIVAALRAAGVHLSPVELAELLDRLTEGKLSQSTIVKYFFDAFPSIPLRVLRRTGSWTRVTGGRGSLFDEGLNELLCPWLPGKATVLFVRATNRLKEEAERLRVGLAFGLLEPADAITWADRLIEEEPGPPDEWLLDISLAHGAEKKDWGGMPESPKDLLSALQQVPGEANVEEVVRSILDQVRDRYIRQQWDEWDVVSVASNARFRVQLPDDVESWIFGLEDWATLCDNGVFEEDALARELAAFFERFCTAA